MTKGGSGQGISQFNLHDDKKAHDESLAKAKALLDVLNEACKASLAINGGAAVAMGALLQAIVDRPSLAAVRTALLWGIAIEAIGVLLGASTFLLRYVSLCKQHDDKIFGNGWGKAAFYLGIGSLVTFSVGIGAPIVTAFVAR